MTRLKDELQLRRWQVMKARQKNPRLETTAEHEEKKHSEWRFAVAQNTLAMERIAEAVEHFTKPAVYSPSIAKATS